MNDTSNDVDGSARRLLQIGNGKTVTEPTEAQVEDPNDPHTNPWSSAKLLNDVSSKSVGFPSNTHKSPEGFRPRATAEVENHVLKPLIHKQKIYSKDISQWLPPFLL